MLSSHRDTIVVTGLGWELSPASCDFLNGISLPLDTGNLAHDTQPIEFLKVSKTLKFMSKQDRLALAAAGNAIKMASLSPQILQENTGIFMAVGYIPFKLDDMEWAVTHSQENGQFSMKVFSTQGYEHVNPLITFACLPNMPAHHISTNFSIQNHYFITYPGPLEFYLALQEAVDILNEGRLSACLVGGVADQSNFLVQNHFNKNERFAGVGLADAAAFLVLEREKEISTDKKNCWRLKELVIQSQDKDISPAFSTPYFGPAELPIRLIHHTLNKKTVFFHEFRERSFYCRSSWEPL
jgi:hypothetical protein